MPHQYSLYQQLFYYNHWFGYGVLFGQVGPALFRVTLSRNLHFTEWFLLSFIWKNYLRHCSLSFYLLKVTNSSLLWRFQTQRSYVFRWIYLTLLWESINPVAGVICIWYVTYIPNFWYNLESYWEGDVWCQIKDIIFIQYWISCSAADIVGWYGLGVKWFFMRIHS